MGKKQEPQEWKYIGVTEQTPRPDHTILDVVKMSYRPSCHIKKISKTEYMKGYHRKDGTFTSDGVIYEIQKKEAPMRNRRSLKQIFRALRQLIAANFAGGESELFLTLTYADQHNDPARIQEDIRKFWQNLRYKYKTLKYIAIVEPHASGNFHVHMLISDTTGERLFIPDSEIRRLWGHGITQTERLQDIDHMGAYFIAYFSNLELTPDEVKIYAEQDDIEERNGKSYIKGKRLDYYPEHMRIYRHSKNCDKPQKTVGFGSLSLLNGAQKRYDYTTTWEEDDRIYTINQSQWQKQTH